MRAHTANASAAARHRRSRKVARKSAFRNMFFAAHVRGSLWLARAS